MVNRGLSLWLALLRVAAGVSLFAAGLHKLHWFANPPLAERFAEWSQHPANAFVAKYLHFVSNHPTILGRMVVLGELGLGMLLMVGFLTPLAALLAFFMVLNYQLASGAMFSLNYITGQSGLAYLLIYPVLFLGRAGTALGVDGMLARAGRKGAGP
jgi:uncharacterized membrane protein YphA (DoxX/SURF4 family)